MIRITITTNSDGKPQVFVSGDGNDTDGETAEKMAKAYLDTQEALYAPDKKKQGT